MRRLDSILDAGQLVRVDVWIGMGNSQIIRGKFFRRDQRRLTTRRVDPESEQVMR